MNNSNILHIVTEYKNKIMQLLISNENYRKLLSPEKVNVKNSMKLMLFVVENGL